MFEKAGAATLHLLSQTWVLFRVLLLA